MALFHVFNEVENSQTGVPVAGVQVVARFTGSQTIAPIYANDNGDAFTPANYCITDSTGMYSFYIDAGEYDLDFKIGGQLIRTVEKFRPAEVGPAGPANSTYTSTLALEGSDVANISAILSEAGKAGTFTIRDYPDFTAQVAADTGKVNYIRSTSDNTKVWVRTSILSDQAAKVGTAGGSTVETELAAKAAALGVAATATHLGAFTGSTIPDNQTAKQALQALETAVENTTGNAATKSNATAIGIAATDANMGAYTSPSVPDNQTAKQNIEALGAAVDARPTSTAPRFTLGGSFGYGADFFNPTDDYVRTDMLAVVADSGAHDGKIRFGQFISASSGGSSNNGPGNAFVGFGISNIKPNFLTSTTTQETDGLFIQTKTGRFGDTSAVLADAVAVNVPGVSTSFANMIEGSASCLNTSGTTISKIRFQAGNQYQAGTPGSIQGTGVHIIAEIGTQYSAIDIDNTPGSGSWTYAMRVEKDGVQRLQILPTGYVGLNGTANSAIPLLVNADSASRLAARMYSTDAGTSIGPYINLLRDKVSPANNDNMGAITFSGKNSAAVEIEYARLKGVSVNVTSGTEQGALYGQVNSNGSMVQTFAAFKDSFYISGPLLINNVPVVAARDTGWTVMTGTSDKATAYATSTVTLAQLAGRVMALQAALTTHGLIGA